MVIGHLDNNTQCGHWSMVLNAGNGQATLNRMVRITLAFFQFRNIQSSSHLDCGYFQWFGLHQFTLSLCHSSLWGIERFNESIASFQIITRTISGGAFGFHYLGCECPPCLDGRSLHQPRGHSATFQRFHLTIQVLTGYMSSCDTSNGGWLVNTRDKSKVTSSNVYHWEVWNIQPAQHKWPGLHLPLDKFWSMDGVLGAKYIRKGP